MSAYVQDNEIFVNGENGNFKKSTNELNCEERFVFKQENFIRKVLNSNLFFNFTNETFLKQFFQAFLVKIYPNIKKNVVFYPFYGDFILENYKVVFMVLDQNTLLHGMDNTLSTFQQIN